MFFHCFQHFELIYIKLFDMTTDPQKGCLNSRNSVVNFSPRSNVDTVLKRAFFFFLKTMINTCLFFSVEGHITNVFNNSFRGVV